MRKLRFSLIAIVLTALLAVIVVQHFRTKRLLADTTALREQLDQISALRDENQRLTEQLRAASQTSQPQASELARLRAQATTLRQVEQENARLRAEHERLKRTASRVLQSNPDDSPVDGLDVPHGPGATKKVRHAEYWGKALINYAANHQGEFPATFADAAAFLDDGLSAESKAEAFENADRYELVFHGSQSELDSFPIESTLVMREKEAWMDPQGRWCKTYTFANGFSMLLTYRSKDLFDQFEKIRIPKPKRP